MVIKLCHHILLAGTLYPLTLEYLDNEMHEMILELKAVLKIKISIFISENLYHIIGMQ